jgi:hypothetical protein
MTEMIRRLKLSDLSECKAHAKHERIRNDKRVDTFLKLAIPLGPTMSVRWTHCRDIARLRRLTTRQQQGELVVR